MPSRNPASDASSSDPSYSAATRTISSRFSTRPCASKVPSRDQRVAQAGALEHRPRGPVERAAGLDQTGATSATSAPASATRGALARAGGPDHLVVARRASTTGSPWAAAKASSLPMAPGPEAALGRPEHAGHADPVGRVGHDAQVGEQVAHLGPLVEARAAHHDVGHLAAHELVLDRAALRVGAVEDGDLRQAATRGRARRRSAPATTRASSCSSRHATTRIGSPSPRSVQRRLGCRCGLRATTALAARRMVPVER